MKKNNRIDRSLKLDSATYQISDDFTPGVDDDLAACQDFEEPPKTHEVVKARNPNVGTYYSVATKIGYGYLDNNRRFVYQYPYEEAIIVMNENMRKWTKDDAARLDAVLKALNGLKASV